MWRIRERPAERLRAARFIPAGAGNTLPEVGEAPGGAVHPRGCGEYVETWLFRSTNSGSSPRVRGIPVPPARGCPINRFIPAGAGNTYPACRHGLLATVHPRGCGEYVFLSAGHCVDDGSSPRVRGIRHPVEECPNPKRFIPAGAGNTSAVLAQAMAASGSSPRVRGIRNVVDARQVKLRFIPAGAGNTQSGIAPQMGHAVHPRGCGEYVGRVKEFLQKGGSSPRVRGIRTTDGVSIGKARFIPAGAGNTPEMGSSPVQEAVHPRGCGEYASRSA